MSIETDDFEYAPFSQEGGIGKVYQLFGDELNDILDELNVYLRKLKHCRQVYLRRTLKWRGRQEALVA